ncbi:MAG: hypothetical protein ACE5DK_00915 [Paracoccaceae bacterium]
MGKRKKMRGTMGIRRSMARYEYKCVAAPKRTKAFKGVRSHEDQFAAVLAEIMNDMAAKDWQYLRAESLPCEEKSGLTSRVEAYQSVLIFRRPVVANQKFFEVPPTHQIELHDVTEDRSEQELVFSTAQHTTGVTPISQDMAEPADPATESGVLSILRNRKTRLMREATNQPARNTLRTAAE